MSISVARKPARRTTVTTGAFQMFAHSRAANHGGLLSPSSIPK